MSPGLRKWHFEALILDLGIPLSVSTPVPCSLATAGNCADPGTAQRTCTRVIILFFAASHKWYVEDNKAQLGCLSLPYLMQPFSCKGTSLSSGREIFWRMDGFPWRTFLFVCQQVPQSAYRLIILDEDMAWRWRYLCGNELIAAFWYPAQSTILIFIVTSRMTHSHRATTFLRILGTILYPGCLLSAPLPIIKCVHVLLLPGL